MKSGLEANHKSISASDDFEYFLRVSSYGKSETPETIEKLRVAFYHGWPGCDLPEVSPTRPAPASHAARLGHGSGGLVGGTFVVTT